MNFSVLIPNYLFWDKEIVDFWLCVPIEKRMGRKIFFEVEQNGILVEKLKNIPFAKEKYKSLKTKLLIS